MEMGSSFLKQKQENKAKRTPNSSYPYSPPVPLCLKDFFGGRRRLAIIRIGSGSECPGPTSASLRDSTGGRSFGRSARPELRVPRGARRVCVCECECEHARAVRRGAQQEGRRGDRGTRASEERQHTPPFKLKS
uniref:uncharacterized protein LOC118152393 n=1 Tax=Callithrix jacchus TaxID=9483 RepID=UPI0004F00832|nr:uncharacterized protein LOC118152393 [Callithrix jacchus]